MRRLQALHGTLGNTYLDITPGLNGLDLRKYHAQKHVTLNIRIILADSLLQESPQVAHRTLQKVPVLRGTIWRAVMLLLCDVGQKFQANSDNGVA